MGAARRHVGLLWPCLGLLGSAATAGAATRLLARRPIPWWWRLPLLHSHNAAWHLFWAGVIVLCVAWLGLGRRLRLTPDAQPRDVTIVAALWALPLALGPALFSLDLYSYLAQGLILHHGLNPYRTAPAALARWHDARLLGAVSSTWRHTTAPYGPVFLAIASVIAGVSASHITLGVTLLRLPELAGVGLLAVYAPRLARTVGADPVRATWLAVASPLTLLYLIGGGHNDALMAGLVVAGVACAAERRWLAAIALCALAATIKLPAAAGIAVIGVCWLRAEPQRWRVVLGGGAAVTGAIGIGAGLLVGVGLTWISGSLFSTPETVRLALTPATDVAVSIYGLVHGHVPDAVGLAARATESTAITVAVAITGLIALWLLWRARPETLVRSLGVILLAAALGGPAAWPWYLSWGVTVLACDPVLQRRAWLPALAVVAVFPVMAGGQVKIELPHAPRVLVVYAVVAIGLALTRAGARRRLGRPHSRVAVAAPVPSPKGAG